MANPVFNKNTQTFMFLHINIHTCPFQHANSAMLLTVGPGPT